MYSIWRQSTSTYIQVNMSRNSGDKTEWKRRQQYMHKYTNIAILSGNDEILPRFMASYFYHERIVVS